MSTGAGVLRRAETLIATAAELDLLAAPTATPPDSTTACELANLVTVAQRLLDGAVAREESRGCHRRAEYPAPSPHFSLRFIQ
jgi:L-aspartate oxidase